MVYQLLLSFVAENSLEQAMLIEDDADAEAERATEWHTPRRSPSAHYGVVRHALRHLLREAGVPGGVVAVTSCPCPTGPAGA